MDKVSIDCSWTFLELIFLNPIAVGAKQLKIFRTIPNCFKNMFIILINIPKLLPLYRATAIHMVNLKSPPIFHSSGDSTFWVTTFPSKKLKNFLSSFTCKLSSIGILSFLSVRILPIFQLFLSTNRTLPLSMRWIRTRCAKSLGMSLSIIFSLVSSFVHSDCHNKRCHIIFKHC